MRLRALTAALGLRLRRRRLVRSLRLVADREKVIQLGVEAKGGGSHLASVQPSTLNPLAPMEAQGGPNPSRSFDPAELFDLTFDHLGLLFARATGPGAPAKVIATGSVASPSSPFSLSDHTCQYTHGLLGSQPSYSIWGRVASRVKDEVFPAFRASSWQAGRRPDRSAISRRVPRRGADVAGAGSKSSLKGRHERSAKGAGVGRRTRAGLANDDDTVGLCAPRRRAIPIAPLQRTAIPTAALQLPGRITCRALTARRRAAPGGPSRRSCRTRPRSGPQGCRARGWARGQAALPAR